MNNVTARSSLPTNRRIVPVVAVFAVGLLASACAHETVTRTTTSEETTTQQQVPGVAVPTTTVTVTKTQQTTP